MSFNVTPYLRDIDAEIAHHRAVIATLRLKIVELEDMRVLIMQREEYRAASNGGPSPFGALHGAEIAVREQRHLTEQPMWKRALLAPALTRDEKAERQRQKKRDYQNEWQRRKREKIEGPLNKAGNRRGMNNPPGAKIGRRPINKGELHPEAMRERVLAVLRAGPLDAHAVAVALGYGDINHKAPPRRSVGNTLARLTAKGLIVRDEAEMPYLYALAPEAQP